MMTAPYQGKPSSAQRGRADIAFVFRSVLHFHYYKSIVAALIGRGHAVAAYFDPKWSKDDSLEVVQGFARAHPTFTYAWAHKRNDWWREPLFYLRELRSYRRYLLVPEQSQYYKDRWLGYLPHVMRKAIRWRLVSWFLARRWVGHFFAFLENRIPADALIMKQIAERKASLVIAGPADMRFSSADLEYLKAAKKLRVPTVTPVLSWDNLTTKGLLHVLPDVLLAWNRAQEDEAVIHHAMPRERIRVIGSPVFDGCFSHLTPHRTRDAFCREYGLRADLPMILYLGSSKNMAEDETWIVQDLRAALAASSDERIREAHIIVRPHPSNFDIYEALHDSRIVVLPRTGKLPDTADAAALLYDCVHHAAAVVVGVNTSAAIEAMILGKPVIALVTDRYRATQRETQHFRQLLEKDAIYLAEPIAACAEIVRGILAGRDAKKDKRNAFIGEFVRPRGLDRAAGSVAAEEIEALVEPSTSRFS